MLFHLSKGKMMIKIVFKWQEEKKDFQCAFNLKCGKEKDRIDKDRRLETKKEPALTGMKIKFRLVRW